MNCERKFKFLSTKKVKNFLPTQIDLDYVQTSSSGKWQHALNSVRLLAQVRQYDAFIAFNPRIDHMLVAFVIKRIMRRTTLFVFFDAVLHRPNGLRGRIKCWLTGILLSGVDRFICVHKDVSGYQKYYNLPATKFSYVPFKANNYNDRAHYASKDGNYLVSGGVSHRDYETLFAAVRTLGVPTKIVMPKIDLARYHGTLVNEEDIPENVEIIVDHQLDKRLWYQHIAEARIVVIPIQRDVIQAAGISVCLEAMALCKPVIITEGVSTRNILTKNEAEIVPPNNALALAEAIVHLWNSRARRELLGKTGQRFALSLGSEERMLKDILQCACTELQK